MFLRKSTLRRCRVPRVAFPVGLDRTRAVALALTFFSGMFASAPAFTQPVEPVNQINLIDINNPGEIGTDGSINAEIVGNPFDQTNSAPTIITNTKNLLIDDFLQSAQVTQSNIINAKIAIDNSQDFDADDIGINAAISNNTFSQTNGAPITITNTGDISTFSFTQSAQVSQSNAISPEIAIDNSRRVKTNGNGINAVITENTFSQRSRAATAITNTGYISTFSFTQSAELSQGNTIDTKISIDNSGYVEAGNIGIDAEIVNNTFSQTNSAATAITNTGDVPTFGFAQSAEVSQSNSLNTEITIDNNGYLKANDIGISAVIADNIFTQTNNATTAITNSDEVTPIGVPQSNEIAISIAIDNSGIVEGGSTGISAEIGQPSVSNNIAIINSGSIFGGALGIQALGGIAGIANTGLIHAYNQGPNAFATGIDVIGLASITNDAGTIWAGFSTDSGAIIQRGAAINTANDVAVVQLQGTQGDGHIYGDIYISPLDDTKIQVTQGTTFFEGIIKSGEQQELHGSLDIVGGGKLVLCQEGWSDACDPKGWGNANWDPQEGTDGPSLVFIDTFTVGEDGTIVYQLTPDVNTHPQVNAEDASVNGTLVAQYLPGFYAKSFHYDDLVVANNLNTDGLGVKDNSILLNTTLSLPGDDTIGLDVTRTKFNAVGGLSKNEKAAASGIEHIYGKLPGVTVNPASTNAFGQLVAKLFTVDNKATYLAVLDQLSGAQYAQQLQSVLWSLRPLDKSVTDRMSCRLNQTMVPVAQGYSDGCFRPGQFQTWARAWGGWNNNDGDIEAPGYDEQQWAIWGGGDYGISNTFMIGFAGGFFRSNMDFNNFGGVPGGKIEYDGGQIAGYAAWDSTIWYNRAIVSGGWYSGDSHHNFALESSPVDPSGSPDANAVSFYNELGRRFGVGTGVMLTPFAGITVSHAELDGFTENDHNTGAALKVAGSDGDSVASLLGLRLSGEWWGAFKPQVALAWEHEFDDTFQTINASFAGAPSGSNFKVRGTELGEDTFVVDAGAEYALGPNNDLSLRYVGRFLDDYDAQTVMGRWTYKFGAAPLAAAPPPVINRPLK